MRRVCCLRHPCMIDGKLYYMCQHVEPARPLDISGNWAFDRSLRLKEINPTWTKRFGFVPAYQKES